MDGKNVVENSAGKLRKKQQGISRRNFLKTSALFAISGSLGGLRSTRAYASPSEIKLNFLGSSGASAKCYTVGINMFNKLNKGKIKVEADLISWGSIPNRLMMQFVSGKPTSDVFQVDGNWLPGFCQYCEPLNNRINSAKLDLTSMYGPDLVTYASADGTVYGIPVRQGIELLYYRKDLLEQSGLEVPKNLVEFEQVANRLFKDHQLYGHTIKAQVPTWTAWSFSSFFYPNGGRTLTPDLKGPSPSLKSDLAYSILDMLMRLKVAGVTPDPLGWTYQDDIAAIQSGRVAMTNEWSMRARTLEDPKVSKITGKLGCAPLPEGSLGDNPPKHVGGGHFFMMDKNTPYKDAAFEFLKFMGNFEAQRAMAIEADNGPTHLGVLEDPEYIKSTAAAPTLLKVLKTTGVFPQIRIKQNKDVVNVIHEEIHQFFLQKQNARVTCSRMYDRIGQTLKG